MQSGMTLKSNGGFQGGVPLTIDREKGVLIGQTDNLPLLKFTKCVDLK